MPRPDPASISREQRVQSITNFVTQLRANLPNVKDVRTIDLLKADVSHHISAVTSVAKNDAGSVPAATAKHLEQQGRGLWNLCIRLKRSDVYPQEGRHLLARARMLAYCVIEASRAKRSDGDNALHLLGLVLIASRGFMEVNDLESLRALLERAAAFVLMLDGHSGSNDSKNLTVEYFAMRLALAWKQNQMDVAEHLFSKTEKLQLIDAASAETLADTLRHIGADLSAKADHVMAIKWLRRANSAINSQELDRLSAEGVQNRLAICHDLIQALVASSHPSYVAEATDLVGFVESEIGDKPIVLHWRLEILQKSSDETFDAESYACVLQRMVRIFDFSAEGFGFLMNHIRKLHGKNFKLGRNLLDVFLTQKLLQSQNIEWIGKAVVNRLWMATSEVEDVEQNQEAPLELLNDIYKAVGRPLPPDISGAVHALLWKKVEATTAQNHFTSTEAWCSIALHDIFSECGSINRAKFGRKLIICALGLNDAEKARKAFSGLPLDAQNEGLTRYLMFKVSLQCWDCDLGKDCIEQVSRYADESKSQDILYACVREAQQVGDKLCTLTALQAIAQQWNSGKASTSVLTSVLRCSVRLIRSLEEQQAAGCEIQEERVNYTEDTCLAFERAAKCAREGLKDEQGNKIFTVSELHWFRKNSYNIGVGNLGAWDLASITRIYSACLSFIDCYPEDIPRKEAEDLALTAMRCHFIIASALINLARAEKKLDEKFQRYVEMRQHIVKFDELLETEALAQDPDVLSDIVLKTSALSVFDFEGAVELKSWDDLSRIVRKTVDVCKDERVYKAMGDCLLRSQAPAKVKFSIMRLLINQIYGLASFDTVNLSKYIRCVFQAILPVDDSLAFSLLNETLHLARESREQQTTLSPNKNDNAAPPLPQEEMEWLVATSFNHAVDLYARGESHDVCHRWASGAMDLAAYIGDGGELTNLLQTKFARLRFEGRA